MTPDLENREPSWYMGCTSDASLKAPGKHGGAQAGPQDIHKAVTVTWQPNKGVGKNIFLAHLGLL